MDAPGRCDVDSSAINRISAAKESYPQTMVISNSYIAYSYIAYCLYLIVADSLFYSFLEQGGLVLTMAHEHWNSIILPATAIACLAIYYRIIETSCYSEHASQYLSDIVIVTMGNLNGLTVG